MTLDPLRWLVNEDVIYDPLHNVAHSARCAEAPAVDVLELAAGEVLALQSAPEICWTCQPSLTMRLPT